MSYRYINYPFAASGTVTPVPTVVPMDGSVNYQQGYTPLYSLDLQNDPAALPITRGPMNQIFNDVTTILQQYQQIGIPYFITTAQNLGTPYSYGLYSMAMYDAGDGNGIQQWQSVTTANTTTPAVGNTSWVNKNRSPMAYVAAQTYYIDDFVTYDGNLYVSLTDSNIGNTPGTGAVNWQEYVAASGNTPIGVKNGLQVSCLSNLFTITKGSCTLVDTTTVATNPVTWTKSIGAWVQGNGNGAALVSLAANTWGYFFLLSSQNGDQIDFAYDNNPTCNNIATAAGAGLVTYRRIGFFYYDGTNVINFYYDGNYYYSSYLSGNTVVNLSWTGISNSGFTEQTLTQDLSANLPPALNIDAEFLFALYLDACSSNTALNFYSSLDAIYNTQLLNAVASPDGYSLIGDITLTGYGSNATGACSITGTKKVLWQTGTRDINARLGSANGISSTFNALAYGYAKYLIDNFTDF